MLKDFYLILTPAHQDLVFVALVYLGFFAAIVVIILIFIIIIKLLWK